MGSVTKESSFSVAFIPAVYHKRILHPWSVHKSPSSQKYVATMTLSSRKDHTTQFLFDKDRQARKFCQAFAPPKLQKETVCKLCESPAKRKCCLNCGATICDRCTRRWSLNMVPKTYVQLETQRSSYIRVCKSCDWLSNAFCMALLQGRKEDAMMIYETGNVNLRTTFAGIRGETMFPVHCAVLGGSLDMVRWLVESQLCSIWNHKRNHKKTSSLQTSERRTLIDLAMTGNNPVDTLQYLVGPSCNLSIHDVKDASLAPKTLEYLLKKQISRQGSPATVMIPDDDESSVEEDAEMMCRLCCEQSCGDSVLVPCGHQVCCHDCGGHLQHCPICKAPCSVLRIFRP